MVETIRILVIGKVQGVYFRQSTKEKALALGLTGTVENLKDASVLIIATGEQAQLNLLIEWCKKGPKMAQVSEVSTETIPLTLFESFTITR